MSCVDLSRGEGHAYAYHDDTDYAYLRFPGRSRFPSIIVGRSQERIKKSSTCIKVRKKPPTGRG